MPTVEVNGTKLNFIDTGGDGPVVVLLHAFPLSASMWEPQIDALGDRFRLVAPDLKGFGGSDAPADRSDYSVDSYAAEVKGLLDELGISSITLVGLSMGGYIAFAFLRKYRDIVKALVLADTRAEADPPEGVAKRSGQQEQVEAEGTAGMIEALPNALLGQATRDKKQDVVDNITRLMDQPGEGYIGALEALKTRPDSTADLSQIDVPTLIIVGEEDGLTPAEFSRKMHEHIGGSRLVVIPEAGHLSNLEAPDAFNGALAEFLGSL